MVSEWSSDQLGNLVQFKTGKLNSNAAVPNGLYPFFTCSQETFRTNTCAFDTECVLLAGNNANGVYPLKYFKGKFDAYQRTYVITPLDTSRLDIRFLYYAMRPMLEHLRSISTGATTKFVTLTILNGLILQFPPLPTQRKIASILSAYDDLIENNTRRIAILEEMAQAIYREWFVNFRFPGHENVKLVESTLGMIPEGWEVVSLSSLMEIKGGTQPPKSVHVYQSTEGYVRLIQIRDYQSDKHPTFVPSSGKLNTCNERDIMIARYGASVARICWGLSGAYNVALTKVLPAKPIYRIFLKEFLSSDFFQHSLIGMSGRAAQNGFNKGDISAILLARPIDDRLFDHFSEIGIPMESAILGLRRRNENLRTTRDLLLPKLIAGQLDVEELDIDLGMTAEALEEATT
jgi:type I restriction enzyme S subunit